MSEAWAIRTATAADAPHILDSFARSYATSAFAAGLGPEALRALLKPLLARWQTLVAVAADDADHILGWLCYRDARTVAYVHVKRWFRGRGVARALAAAAGLELGRPLTTPFVHTRAEMRVRGLSTVFRPFLVVEEALRG